MAAVYKEQLGELIKEKREALGLTQRELADKAHVKESTTVSRWERGEREPTDLEAVARALDTTASEMLSQLSPLHQKTRKRLDPSAPSQMDRIEAKLDEVLSRLPEQDLEGEILRETAEADRQDALNGEGNGTSVHTANRSGRAQ
jgi:transcriptional regulator with XRE-family HTH domain